VYLKHLLVFLVILLPLLAVSQSENEIIKEKSDTVRLVKETVNGTFTVELANLNNLNDTRIDSLLSILEEKTAPDSETIFGHSLFGQKFELVDDNVGKSIVQAPESYVIGKGDELSISIFGTSQYLGSYIVDNKGFIYPDDMIITKFLFSSSL